MLASMADFIPFKEVKRHLRKPRHLLDRMNFAAILLIWVGIVVLFGIIYHVLQTDDTQLFYVVEKQPLKEAADAVYFSFVAATTTGFGDIVPQGWFKLLAIAEVVLGLLLLALVTSKLVSLKQDIILGELYEISFYEKINRLRSTLLLFRQNLDKVMTRVEENRLKTREIPALYMYLSSFEDVLNEFLSLVSMDRNRYLKDLDPVSAELLLSSMVQSFEKVNELAAMLDEHKIAWNDSLTSELLKRCSTTTHDLFDRMRLSKDLRKEVLENLTHRKNAALRRFVEQ